MMSYITKGFSSIIKYTGFNREILWSSYNQLWGTLKGPISIFFILTYLLPEEQGLWYTFLNLAALKIFAELGFTMIVTQFVSHEFANVEFKNGKLFGEFEKIDRIISLIKYSIKFYFKVIPFAILIMMVIGYFYFSSNSIKIFIAWCTFSVLGGLALFLSIFQAIFKGLDKVKVIQKNLLLGSILMGLGNWLFLFFDFDIWALIIGNAIGIISMIINLYYIAPDFWNQIKNYIVKKKYNWFGDIMNLQWKYAISWASGYFIFNMIVPVLFKFESAELAGQYGISIRIISTCIAISQAWIFTKIPKFNILVAQNNLKGLDHLFNKSIKQAVIIQVLLSAILFCVFLGLNYMNIYADRFLTLKYIFILLLMQVPIQIVNFLAIYLRSFKKEPFVIYSIINALIISGGLLIVLPNFDFNTLMYYMLISYWVLLLPYAVWIFFTKRKQLTQSILD